MQWIAREHDGFGHAIALQWCLARCLGNLGKYVCGQWRATTDQQSQTTHGRHRTGIREPRIHGWDAKKHGRLRCHVGYDLRIKTWQDGY